MKIEFGQTIIEFALSVGSLYIPAIFPDAVYISRLKRIGRLPPTGRRLGFGCFLFAVCVILVSFSPFSEFKKQLAGDKEAPKLVSEFKQLAGDKEAPKPDPFTETKGHILAAALVAWLLSIPVTLLCAVLNIMQANARELKRRSRVPALTIGKGQ